MKRDKIDKNKIFKIILMAYFIISPIFEIVYFYNHITTLIRILCILVFALIVFIKYKESRRWGMFLLSYYLAMGGYLVISFIHSKGFSSLVPGNFNYSVISEATTLLKLCVPFTILYILKYVKFSKKEFFIVINSWVFIIAGSIVLFNVCGFSLSSYTNEITRYSIFSWGNNLSVNDSATKGFFVFANQEAVILLMLLVLTVYEFIFQNKKNVFLVVLVSLASLMLGTRISTYGGVLVLFGVTILYVFYNLYFKKQIEKRIVLLGILGILWIMILPIAPCNNRVEEIKKASEPVLNEEYDLEYESVKEETTNIDTRSDFDNFTQNINKRLVGEQFYLKFYPYEFDKEFWEGVLIKQQEVTLNYRVLELMIIKRVIKIDNRKTDYLFGISNSRIQNITNIERDFVLQFYAFGFVGVMLVLLVYPYMIWTVGNSVLRDKKFIDLILLACLGVFILGAYASGNNLNFLAAVIPLSFIVSFCKKLEEE